MDHDKDGSVACNRSLVEITDLLGLSNPSSALVREAGNLMSAIIRGVGNIFDPWLRERSARADVNIFEMWKSSLETSMNLPSSLELSIGERSAIRLNHQEVRRQLNREHVALGAVDEFRQAESRSKKSQFEESISADWIDYFWNKCQDVSDERMRSIWSRVLARQTAGSAQYSMRTLDVLRTLSGNEADRLEHIAKYAVRVPCLPQHGTGVGLIFGLSARKFGEVKYIDEEYLGKLNKDLFACVGDYSRELFGSVGIYLEDGWAYEFAMTRRDGEGEIILANRKLVISGFNSDFKDNEHTSRYSNFAHGIQISPLGSEIMTLINSETDERYFDLLVSGIRSQGLIVNVVAKSFASEQ